jgi:anti-anti-sigma factor
MSIQIETVGDVAVVIAEGTFIGGKETEELDAALMGLMVEEGRQKVLLHLSGTTFLGSSSIGVIAAAHGHAEDFGLDFWLCGLNKRIQDVLDFMKLGPELKIFQNCEEALTALKEL